MKVHLTFLYIIGHFNHCIQSALRHPTFDELIFMLVRVRVLCQTISTVCK